MDYIIINGVSTADLDICILTMPHIPVSERKVDKIEIAGRHGLLYEEKEYQNTSVIVECLAENMHRSSEIMALLQGNLKIVFGNDLSKLYHCRLKNQIDLQWFIENHRTFVLVLDCQPFKYSATPLDDEITLTSATKIHNKGTFDAEPIFEIYGSGDVTLSINGKVYKLKGMDAAATINSEIQEVYKDKESWNNKFEADEFPIFKVGENEMSWTGNVSKIVIQPNWRWL